LAVVIADHPGDQIFPSPVQYLQHVSMRRARIVVEKFDAPIPLAADLAGGLQDDLLQDLPPSHCLDRSDQAVAAVSITQSALAPLLLSREQPLYGAEPGEGMIIESVCTVERHIRTSELLMLHGCPRPRDAGIWFRLLNSRHFSSFQSDADFSSESGKSKLPRHDRRLPAEFGVLRRFFTRPAAHQASP
jgi:hypothetical protein